MLSFSSLAILPLLISTPAELGGTVVARATGQPFPSPVPIVLNLYSGSERVASAQPDLFGRYSLGSPPGDYWLQIQVGGEEQSVERVFLRPGSWKRDFEVGSPGVPAPAWANQQAASRAKTSSDSS